MFVFAKPVVLAADSKLTIRLKQEALGEHNLGLFRLSTTDEPNVSDSTASPLPEPLVAVLARGPRFRLQAELVRDNALAISGLLVDQFGCKAYGRGVRSNRKRDLSVTTQCVVNQAAKPMSDLQGDGSEYAQRTARHHDRSS